MNDFSLTDEDRSTLREAAIRGAAFLDRWDATSRSPVLALVDQEPWYRLVNLDTLNMGSSSACVLVQLYRTHTGNRFGTWSGARTYVEGTYGGTDMEFPGGWPMEYGFDAYHGENGYRFLRNVWIEEITKRQESGTAC